MKSDEEQKEYQRKKMRKWRAVNRERSNEIARKSWAKHKDRLAADPEFCERRRAADKKHRDENRETRRASWRGYAQKKRTEDELYDRRRALKAAYGLSLEDYEAMVLAQDGHCAICYSDNPGNSRYKFWSVDHCHAGGKVRGLLCHGCNTGLGGFKDSLELLDKAMQYLRRHGGS